MTWIICDMDGTVVDSMSKLRTLGIHVLQLAGGFGRENAEASYDATVGQPFVEQCRISLGDDDTFNNECARIYADVHEMLAPYFPLTPFGLALTERPPRFSLGLVSSTSVEIINQMPILSTISWDCIRGFDGKHPKRIQIEQMMAIYEISNCIYVGDVESDREIAERLGIQFMWPDDPTLFGMLAHA